LHRFTVLPTVPDALTPLRVLAHNLRWSWHPATQELFRAIDPAGWEACGHKPLRMLNERHHPPGQTDGAGPPRARAAPRRPRLPRPPAGPARGPRALPGRASLVPDPG